MTHLATADELRRAHAEARMVGWDFSRFGDRLTSDDPPWDFEMTCIDALRNAEFALDMGTGGGERLIALLGRLGDDRPAHLWATEGWEPNIPVATANLAPLGIEVRRYDAEDGDRLPFEDACLEVVMNRHESCDFAEVARVLRPGGVLLIQQVGGDDAEELRQGFGADQLYPQVRLDVMTADAEAAGLRVTDRDDWSGSMVFADALALVEYLAMVPWDVPDFRVDDHLDRLFELDRSAPIKVTQRRFWFRAVRG